MKIKRFVKDWMLPIAIVAGILTYLLFHNVPALGAVAGWYYPYNNTVMPLCTFLVLFVTFCKVDFRKLMPVKWHLWIGLIQIALVLFLVWMINAAGGSNERVVLFESALACMICPCATAAAVMTAKLGGNLEETTSYTFLSNIFSAFLISLLFPLLPHASGGEVLPFLTMFATILKKVSFALFVPMLAAFVVKHCFRRLHRAVTSVRDLGYYLWAVSIVVDAGTTAMNIDNSRSWVSMSLLAAIATTSMFVCLVQYIIGRSVGSRFGKTIDCGQAMGQKNTTVAIWVSTVFLNPLASVGPGCYILWQNLVNSVMIYAKERKDRRQITYPQTLAPRLASSRVPVGTKRGRAK